MDVSESRRARDGASRDVVTLKLAACASKLTCCLSFVRQPKLRIPKQGLSLVDVTGPGEYNNGHIEILPAPEAERIAYEDVVLSNKRYRVPEQSIIVDFWSKVLGRPRAIKLVKTSGAGGLARGVALSNRSGSPLTSLDSDSEDDSDIASVASSSDLSTLRSEAGESIANGETLAAPVVSHLLDGRASIRRGC